MYRMLQVMYAYKVKQLIIADNAVCTRYMQTKTLHLKVYRRNIIIRFNVVGAIMNHKTVFY